MNQSKLKCSLTLKSGKNMPMLGLKSQASPFVIIEFGGRQYISEICKFSKNPTWMSNFQIQSIDETQIVHFYVYNSNPNHIDELLGFTDIEFSELMTQVPTQSKLKLKNALNYYLESYLYIEHFDCHPRDRKIELNEKSCLRLFLLSDLPNQTEIYFHYGERNFKLDKKQNFNQNTFVFNGKERQIEAELKIKSLSKVYSLKTIIMVENIVGSTCFCLRFYHHNQLFKIYVGASVIANGLFPPTYNSLEIKEPEVKKSGMKLDKYRLRITGPFNGISMEGSSQENCLVYIQNSIKLSIAFFEDVLSEDQAEPNYVFKIPINTLNWSQTYESSETFKYFDSFRNTETLISLQFKLVKTPLQSTVIPKFMSPKAEIYDHSSVLIEQIKISNCFLGQILNQSTIQLLYIDSKNRATVFNSFAIKKDQIEYNIKTHHKLLNENKGQLHLISLQMQFDEQKVKSFQNSTILTINLRKQTNLKIQQCNLQYNNKFLSFAKKVSLVHICKKFNQMVHDNLMMFKYTKSRLLGQFRQGQLQIINAKVQGNFCKVEINIEVDGSSIRLDGQAGVYLGRGRVNKLSVVQGNIKIKVKVGTITKEINGFFWDLFGTPNHHDCYCYEMKLAPDYALKLYYQYIPSKATSILGTFHPNSYINQTETIKLKLKSAMLANKQQVEQSIQFKLTRGTIFSSSLEYKPNNNLLLFHDSEQFVMESDDKYVFVNAYCRTKQGMLIYSGFIKIVQLLRGYGLYEVSLKSQKEDSNQEILIKFQCIFSNEINNSLTNLKMTIQSIRIDKKNIIRTIYKHYLVIKINSSIADIIQCSKASEQDTLKVGNSFILQKGNYYDFELFISYKSISKQLFECSQKELIGSTRKYFEEIPSFPQFTFTINYIPSKQIRLRYSKIGLVSLQNDLKFIANYQIEKSKSEEKVMPVVSKVKSVDIDVLSAGFLVMDLVDFYCFFYRGKILQIKFLKPFNMQFCCQSIQNFNQRICVAVNNFQTDFEAIITVKVGDKYRKYHEKDHIYLKGSGYKTNSKIFQRLLFDKVGIINFNYLLLSNKFVTNYKGEITLKEVAVRGVKLQNIDIYFLKKQSESQNLKDKQYDKIDKNFGSFSCNFNYQTDSMLNGLCFVFSMKSGKVKKYVHFGEINIDKIEEQIFHELSVHAGNQIFILSLKIQYKYKNQLAQSQIVSNIKYEIQDGKQVSQHTVNYQAEQFSQIYDSQRKLSTSPLRIKGFSLTITMPPSLLGLSEKVEIIADRKQNNVDIRISNQFDEQLHKNIQKELQIKGLKLHCKKYIEEIDNLGVINGRHKFMFNQDPKLICSIIQLPYQIAAINKDPWTITIKFDRLSTLKEGKKRLLRLKNSPNDQILTNHLGILLQHGTQRHLIKGINQYGQLHQKRSIYSFGFDPSVDEIEVFLFLQNYFNENGDPLNLNFDDFMQYMPVCYGTISLEKIKKNGNVGCNFKRIPNKSKNLNSSFDNIVEQIEPINFLCSLAYEKRSWGYVRLKLIECSPILFYHKTTENTCWVYFKVEIEDSHRKILVSLTTNSCEEKRKRNIKFSNNLIEFLFIQKNQNSEGYNLKLTGYVIEDAVTYNFVEKRVDLSDSLRKRGHHKVNVQIKPAQANNFCENVFNLNFQVQNSICPFERENVIQLAQDANKVDIVSFKQKTNIEVMINLLNCQHKSHFIEVLTEIKESFIYSDDLQIDLFCKLVRFLEFDCDQMILLLILDIISSNIMKSNKAITAISEDGSMDFVYQQFKELAAGKDKDIPSNVVIVKSEEYENLVSIFKDKNSKQNFLLCVEKQKHIIFKEKQFERLYSSTKMNKQILNILISISKYHKEVKEKFNNQLRDWIEIFSFKEKEEFNLFMLLVKNNSLNLDEEEIINFVQVLVARKEPLSVICQYWQKIKTKKQVLYLDILQKYEEKFTQNSVETARGIKIMLTSLIKQKNVKNALEVNNYEGYIKTICENVRKGKNIIQINGNSDLFIYLLDQKIVNKDQKDSFIEILKHKEKEVKENSSKIIINSMITKMNKNMNSQKSKKQGAKNEMDEKFKSTGIYRKYLITSD